ncbi:MAG TPA: apolipoprotein N-acyltransferase [Steroidobacteraceae bacterium]|nr:apolipoprotein N-acyltransferase [Steroidobacteraceae bacterium]
MTQRWFRAGAAFAAPAAAGALSSLGFEPLVWWPLTFIAMAFLLDCIARAPRARTAFGVGWLFAAGHFLVGLNWIATAFTYQANMPASFGIGAVVLLSFYLALFPAISAAVTWRVYRGRTVSLGFVLLFAALWIATEWLRGVLFTGFAWNPLGTVWLAVPPIAHAARWIGVYGLSGVLIATAGALWLAFRGAWRAAVGVAVALGALAVVSISVPSTPIGRAIPVRIVQPNIGQEQKYDVQQVTRNERIYMRLSRTPTTHPRLILWPEDATFRFLELEPAARAALARLLEPGDVLLTGGESVTLDEQGEPKEYHNSVFALGSDGSLLWRYDKKHLVPFGEYLPLRPILERIGLSRLVPGEGDFARGTGPGTFDVPGFGAVGVQVCYEIIFSGHVLERAHRPVFLFNPSNDAWFGAWGPPQHLAQARMRAIEEGVPVVRATPTGISGVIGPDGAVVRTLPPGREGVLDTVVPPAYAPTLFARVGLRASGAFALALGVAGLVLSRRRPGM